MIYCEFSYFAGSDVTALDGDSHGVVEICVLNENVRVLDFLIEVDNKELKVFDSIIKLFNSGLLIFHRLGQW